MIVDVLGFEASKSQCPLVTIPSKTKMTQLEHARIISVWAVARGGGIASFEKNLHMWHFQIGQYNQMISHLVWFIISTGQPLSFPPAPPHHCCDSMPTHWAPVGDQRAICFLRVNFTNMTTNGKETYQKLYLYNFYSCLENNNNKLLV